MLIFFYFYAAALTYYLYEIGLLNYFLREFVKRREEVNFSTYNTVAYIRN